MITSIATKTTKAQAGDPRSLCSCRWMVLTEALGFLAQGFLFPQHQLRVVCLILTERAERPAQFNGKLPWALNIRRGVTVEHPDYPI